MSRNVVNNQEKILETIATNTANIKIEADSIDLNLDALEVLVGATNSLLTTLDGVQDNALTKLGEIDTAIDTIDSVLDASLVKHTNNETLLTAQNGLLTTIDGVLDTQVSQLTGIDNVLDNIHAKLPSSLNSDNLKVIDSALDTAIGSMDTNNQNKLDHLSGDLDTLNGKIDTVDGVLDNILVKNTAGEVHLGNIETKLGTIETDIEATNTLLTTLDGVQDNVLTKLGEIDTAIDTLDSVQDNALTKLGEIDTAVDAMSAKLPASLGQKANASSLSTCRSSTAGAYDLSARTTIGTASTTTKLLCDAQGHLQVDILSGGGSTDVSALSTHAKQDTIIGHLDGVETKLDHLSDNIDTLDAVQDNALTKLTNIETLITTLDGVQDNVLTKLGEIDTAIDTLDSVQDNALTKLTGIDEDTNALKIDLAAIEVINTNAEAHLGNIDTGVDVLEACCASNKVKVLNHQSISEGVWINNSAVSSTSFSASLETTGYSKLRLYGVVDSDFAGAPPSINITGSLTDGGTYSPLSNSQDGIDTQNLSISGSSVIGVNSKIDTPPKFIKLYNSHGSTAFTFTLNYTLSN
tara:strand:+ start:8470 stop:10206 length:1737 start_codon:yes stop_codon:yes gene_type:complete